MRRCHGILSRGGRSQSDNQSPPPSTHMHKWSTDCYRHHIRGPRLALVSPTPSCGGPVFFFLLFFLFFLFFSFRYILFPNCVLCCVGGCGTAIGFSFASSPCKPSLLPLFCLLLLINGVSSPPAQFYFEPHTHLSILLYNWLPVSPLSWERVGRGRRQALFFFSSPFSPPFSWVVLLPFYYCYYGLDRKGLIGHKPRRTY
jgi:hypothetical protein